MKPVLVAGNRLANLWRASSAAERWRTGFLLLALAMLIWLGVSPKPWVLVEGLEKWRIPDYVKVYAWWAMLFNLLVVAGLAILSPWWASSRPVRSAAAPRVVATPGWFWPVVLAAMVFCGVMTAQRLNHSLWDDEEYNLRKSIHGRWAQNAGEEDVYFRKAHWRETLYFYEMPNNHVLHSVVARVSLSTWRWLSGAPPSAFSEAALRFPAFVFGLLAVGGLALFLREYGFPAAGAVGAWLMAMHPWILRYGAEARGYSLALFLIPIFLIIWRRTLVSGDWGWWLAWAALQFAAVYAIPTSIFILVVLNLGALPWILLSPYAAGPARVQSGRWFLANSISAMAVIQLMLPLVPQAMKYLNEYFTGSVRLGWPWIRNVLGFFLGGVPWTKTRLSFSDYPEWQPWANAHPAIFFTFAAVVAVLLVVGLLAFSRRGGLWFLVALAFIADPLFIYLQGALKEQFIFEWYLILALPGAVGFTAIGLVLVGRWLARVFRQPWIEVTLPVLALTAYFLVTQPFRSWLIAQPLQAFRESVLVSRGHLPWEQEADSAIVTMSFSDPPLAYESNHHFLRSVDEMIERIKKADEAGAVIYFNIGHPPFAPKHSPKMFKLLENSALFEKVAHFQGFDPTLDRDVYRFKAGASRTFDFTPFRGKDR